jgi:hypothetical protein
MSDGIYHCSPTAQAHALDETFYFDPVFTVATANFFTALRACM